MLEDHPSVGFEGQVVSVKPGFARQTLIPRNMAVYNFPGTRARLFPNIRQSEIDSKMRFYRDLVNFQTKLDNISLEFVKNPSFANPALLKEEISKKDIIKDIHNKHGIEVKPENVILDENISRFGTYSVTVRDFFNAELQRKFEFQLDIQVKQPIIREAREDKEASKDTGDKSSKKIAKDAKDTKSLKEPKPSKNSKVSKETKETKG